MFISLHNFKGKGACWNSKMGNTMSDKRVNYSHELAQTKQQVGYCIVKAFLVHDESRAHMNS